MNPVTKEQWLEGFKRLVMMLPCRPHQEPVVVGYLKRLCATAQNEDLRRIENLFTRLKQNHIYTLLEEDESGTLHLTIFYSPLVKESDMQKKYAVVRYDASRRDEFYDVEHGEFIHEIPRSGLESREQANEVLQGLDKEEGYDYSVERVN